MFHHFQDNTTDRSEIHDEEQSSFARLESDAEREFRVIFNYFIEYVLYKNFHNMEWPRSAHKVSKGEKIRNQYNRVPHLTQDTNGKVTNSQLDTTNESQEVSPFPAGDHKAHINRRKYKTEKHKRSTKEVPPSNGQ